MVKFKVITGCLFFSSSIGLAMSNESIKVKNLGNENNFVYINTDKKYLFLPVEDSAPEGEIDFVYNNVSLSNYVPKVRMSRGKTDYYVPVDLSKFDKDSIVMLVRGVPSSSVCWKDIKVSDNIELETERFRPSYHHTPAYGWMNDPNGMFYKDGEYHLYYQHNPYGSTWGNMHWGHSVSTDLINWRNEGDVLCPDALGTIFSGSCVVDHNNTAGFGEGAVIAFYTSAKQTPWGDCQTQSLAYSLDNGKTFTKYENNPILVSKEKDFRDPKVFWYAPKEHWVMILAVGQHMEIYSSKNLKDWKWESNFGEGQGCHGGVWECPDLMELPVEGTKDKKWVLLCNINPGGPFGGSATQYFVGKFDGTTFVNEYPEETRWMDYGKDHYATVTWSNAPEGRAIAIGWMSNWQYANNVPTKQYRSANTIARDLSLYEENGDILLKSSPSKEIIKARKDVQNIKSIRVREDYSVSLSSQSDNGAYEIEMSVSGVSKTDKVNFYLKNKNGESVRMCYDMEERKFVMDRTQSGDVSFSKDFLSVTEAPLVQSKAFKLRLFVDKSSIEAFINDGEIAMTNCVFPSYPYDTLIFEHGKSSYKINEINIYKLN